MTGVLEALMAMEARLNAWLDRVGALPGIDRLVGAAMGIPATTVILIAAWLTPSPNGYGTHIQLGLGNCTMMVLTEWPCPMCGMTTTFTLLSHFRPLDALLNQPFGVALYAITLAAAAIGLADLATGRGIWRRALALVQRHENAWAWFLLGGMTLGWIYKSVLVHPEVLAWIGLDGGQPPL